jgi:hypothetical protein
MTFWCSLKIQPISFSEMSYALVAGGNPSGSHHDDKKNCPKVEVMFVNGTTKICHSTANYPENVSILTGGSFLKNDLIVACGGYPQTSACYSLSTDLKWTHSAYLTTPNYGLASVIVNNGLWVTGNNNY